MKHFSYLLLFVACFFCIQGVFGQAKTTIKGVILDKKFKLPVPGTVANLQTQTDSVTIAYGVTDQNGIFEIKNVPSGNYRFIIKALGFASLRKELYVAPNTPTIDMGSLELADDVLDELVIKGEVIPVVIKQDTVEFDAAAFKTKPNASAEDLLKKLPGLEVQKDGSVKAQGETVRKVLVDGKPFFTDDPKIATKNIPADMIDKVQVIDQLSDQSQFTGVDDGNREKVINITTKKDMKKGSFGRVVLGAGTQDRYENNLSFNRFKDEQQFSVVGSANNTNVQNFTLGNAFGGGGNNNNNGGGGGGRGVQALAGAFGANTANNNGITTVWSLGANLNTKLGKKATLNGNYFFNNSQVATLQETKRQNILPDTTYFTNQNNNNTNTTDNHRLNLRIDYQIDSLNSLRIIPNFAITKNNYESGSLSRTFSDNQTTLNSGNTNVLTNGNTVNYSSTVLYRHKFRKRGRTFALNLALNGSVQNGENINTTENSFFGVSPVTRNIRQKTEQDNNNNSYRVGLSYTEPISRKRSLEFNYDLSDNLNLSDRATNDFENTTQDYTRPNILLTNNFNNDAISNRFGLNLITQKLKYNYTMGFAVQHTSLVNLNVSKGTNFNKEFINYFPAAQFRYNFGKNRRLVLNYQGRTNAPTSTQLQPVLDNSNPLNTTIGNPDLKQEVVNTVRVNYISYDMNTFRSFFGFLNISTTNNKIASTTQFSNFGAAQNSYQNTNGVFNVLAFGGMGIPLDGNSLILNLNTNFIWARNKSFINTQENTSNNYVIGQGVKLIWNYKQKLDLNLAGNLNYTQADYSLQPQNNANYFTNTVSLDATYTFPFGIILATDFDYYNNSGRADGFNQNYLILSASIAKQLFKDKRGEIRLRVNDALNQNIGIVRTTTDTYIQDDSNVVLKQYFLMTFTYNINRFAASQQPQNNNQRNMGR